MLLCRALQQVQLDMERGSGLMEQMIPSCKALARKGALSRGLTSAKGPPRRRHCLRRGPAPRCSHPVWPLPRRGASPVLVPGLGAHACRRRRGLQHRVHPWAPASSVPSCSVCHALALCDNVAQRQSKSNMKHALADVGIVTGDEVIYPGHFRVKSRDLSIRAIQMQHRTWDTCDTGAAAEPTTARTSAGVQALVQLKAPKPSGPSYRSRIAHSSATLVSRFSSCLPLARCCLPRSSIIFQLSRRASFCGICGIAL